MHRRLLLIAGILWTLVACTGPMDAPVMTVPAHETTSVPVAAGFSLTSTAFAPDGMIPEVYTCRAEATGISPPLAWTEPPPGTQSFALLVEDPDAGSTPFVHWVLFNLSPDLRALPENVPAGESLADGNRQGQNSRRAARYDGPCPPRGIHRYIFTLYALDIRLDPSQVQDKSTLLSASKGHILAQATLIGRFGE